MLRVLPPFLLLALVAPGCGSSPPRSERSIWLQQALVQDNLVWLGREPELVAVKYAKMASDPYFYMRGTAGVFLADLARPGTDRRKTRFLRERLAAQVLLVGDPHPENIGTSWAGGVGDGLTLEVVDLDGATFGPWILDLRRAALGLSVLSLPLEGCGADCREELVEALVEGWEEGLDEPESVKPLGNDTGAIVDWLEEEALEEGPHRDLLLDATDQGADQLRWVTDGVRGLSGIVALTPGEEVQVDRLVAAYKTQPQAPSDLRVLARARRFGAGVASLPAPRFLILYDRGRDGPDDDQALELRQIVDPTPVDFLHPGMPGVFEDNGDRLRSAATRAWSKPDADPRYAGFCDREICFRAASWSSWFQDFDHAKLARRWAEGDFEVEDLEGMAESIGRVLGRAHAQGGTLSGEDSRRAIQIDLATGGGDDALEDELVAHAAVDLQATMDDYLLFTELLAEHGPLLGAEAFTEVDLSELLLDTGTWGVAEGGL